MAPLTTPKSSVNRDLTPPKTSSPGHWLANHNNLAKRVKTYISPSPTRDDLLTANDSVNNSRELVDTSGLPEFDFSPVKSSSTDAFNQFPQTRTEIETPEARGSLEELLQGNFGVLQERQAEIAQETGTGTDTSLMKVPDAGGDMSLSGLNQSDASEASQGEPHPDAGAAHISAHVSVASDITVPNTFDSLYKDNMEFILSQDALIHASLLDGSIQLPQMPTLHNSEPGNTNIPQGAEGIPPIDTTSAVESSNLATTARSTDLGIANSHDSVAVATQDRISQENDNNIKNPNKKSSAPLNESNHDEVPLNTNSSEDSSQVLTTQLPDKITTEEDLIQDIRQTGISATISTREKTPDALTSSAGTISTPIRRRTSTSQVSAVTQTEPRPINKSKASVKQTDQTSEPRKRRRVEEHAMTSGSNIPSESSPIRATFKTPAKTVKQPPRSKLPTLSEGDAEADLSQVQDNIYEGASNEQHTPRTIKSPKSSARRSSQRFIALPVPTPQPTPTKSTSKATVNGKPTDRGSNPSVDSQMSGRSSRSRKADAPASVPKGVHFTSPTVERFPSNPSALDDAYNEQPPLPSLQPSPTGKSSRKKVITDVEQKEAHNHTKGHANAAPPKQSNYESSNAKSTSEHILEETPGKRPRQDTTGTFAESVPVEPIPAPSRTPARQKKRKSVTSTTDKNAPVLLPNFSKEQSPAEDEPEMTQATAADSTRSSKKTLSRQGNHDGSMQSQSEFTEMSSPRPIQRDTPVESAPAIAATITQAISSPSPKPIVSERAGSVEPTAESSPRKRGTRARAATANKTAVTGTKCKAVDHLGESDGIDKRLEEDARSDSTRRSTRQRTTSASPAPPARASRKVTKKIEPPIPEEPPAGKSTAKKSKAVKAAEAPKATTTRASKRKKVDDDLPSTDAVSVEPVEPGKKRRTTSKKDANEAQACEAEFAKPAKKRRATIKKVSEKAQTIEPESTAPAKKTRTTSKDAPPKTAARSKVKKAAVTPIVEPPKQVTTRSTRSRK